MAGNVSMCLVGAMDRLWFHQIILFSEPSPLLVFKPPQAILESRACHSSSQVLSVPSDEETSSTTPDEEISTNPSSAASKLDESDNEEEEKGVVDMAEIRPTRLIVSLKRTRSHSSSPSTQKRPKSCRHGGTVSRLQKSMSCRSLGELELEEVKGFMDLGFVFKKEHLSPRMMSLVPGLERFGVLLRNENKTKLDNRNEVAEAETGEKEDDDKAERGIIRPYLSEAWLIKRPNSPLLNLRVPRVYAADEMKKHLRFWARAVASAIHREC